MKLEQQVVSLELAKQLKELGVKQDSLFYWCSYLGGSNGKIERTTYLIRQEDYGKHNNLGTFEDHDLPDFYSAFTVAELFDYLYTEKGELWIYHNAGMYLVQGFHSEANEENLADCLAKILIANL